jgi:hypothetical protein
MLPAKYFHADNCWLLGLETSKSQRFHLAPEHGQGQIFMSHSTVGENEILRTQCHHEKGEGSCTRELPVFFYVEGLETR